jgi:hypothetical protein
VSTLSGACVLYVTANEGSVPADPNLGQQVVSAKALLQLDKSLVSWHWDSWDTPNAVPLGHPQGSGAVETLAPVGTPRTKPKPHPGDIPNEWSEAIDQLLSRPCPEASSTERWERARRGVEQFAQGWAAKAKSLDWTFEELFALVEPFANVSLQGAAWFVGNSTITAVTADAITLRTEGGATQRAFRKSSFVKYRTIGIGRWCR